MEKAEHRSYKVRAQKKRAQSTALGDGRRLQNINQGCL